MIIILLVFLFKCIVSFSEESAIVFVHLGREIPACIFTALEQARYMNPVTDIYLLVDEKGIQKENISFFHIQNINVIDLSDIEKSKEHRLFCQLNVWQGVDRAFYWTYASERFFVLYDFMRSMGKKDILHLESDCMLYVAIEEIIPLFKKMEASLAAPFQSLYGCIPCLVFIKDEITLLPLLQHMLSAMQNFKGKRAEVSVNDMSTLASFYRSNGKKAFFPLPTLMPNYTFPRRKSVFLLDNLTPLNFLYENFSVFSPYIFDAATLGIFINGSDRRYAPTHGKGTIYVRSLFDPSYFSFFWGEDAQGRSVPYFSFQGVSYRIVNLHLYSKMLEEYASFVQPLGFLPQRKRF
jgi:hypothetical protein